jgi:hypothetical protein
MSLSEKIRFVSDMSGQRNDSEYADSQPTGVLGDQEHAGNSEFEKHDQKTANMYCFFVLFPSQIECH